ncbi:MAG: alpha-L-rhamnosidase C-terminal domain-containing protein [Planctomycetia bacterium]|nr:alpha-L-rhamnosidase C-terminal domain-containing protein [Planctomycetia bacterium]
MTFARILQPVLLFFGYRSLHERAVRTPGVAGLLLLFTVVLCCADTVTAADHFTIVGEHYQATTDIRGSWISAADTPQDMPNLWTQYRYSFDAKEGQTAKIRVACDSKYWLWVNGEMVVFEGGLKRGPARNATYFDLVDLSPFLQEGKNTLAFLVWYFGRDGFSHINSGQSGLLVDSVCENENGLVVRSDGTWKAKLGSAVPTGLRLVDAGKREFETSGVAATWRQETSGPYEILTADPQPNYRLPEWNIRYDARYEDAADWRACSYDDSQWHSAVVCGAAGDAPWGLLFERPIPLWKDYGIKTFVNDAELPKIATGEKIIGTLPYNAQVTPWFKIEAPAGLTIDVRTDNYHGGSEYNVRAEYITKEGVQEYESLGWMNGHKVEFSIPEGVKILGLGYRETGYAADFIGSFTCDDPFYNQLWTKAVRTLYITMRDTYFDCPDRERAQWWGDAVNELGEAFYVFDQRADALPRKGFYELARFQREDKTLYSPVPGVFNTELPAQMLATISVCGLGCYSFYSGDNETACDIYPAIRDYLKIWQFDEEGVIQVRTGDWSWGDWGEDIDLRVLLNCWYYLAVKEAKELALRLNLNDDADFWSQCMTKLEESFDRVFWTGTEYRDPHYTACSDDRANAMAVVSGLADATKYPLVRAFLKEHKHASPYMEKYVLEALCLMGYYDDCLTRMKERFAKMVENEEFTTLWEGWGIGAEGFGGGTINHAWSGGGLTCLAQYITGVAPTEPAFKSFRIFPQMGHLTAIDQTTPTQYGSIVVSLRRTDESFAVKVTVPEGTKGELILPWNCQVENAEVYEHCGEKYHKLDLPAGHFDQTFSLSH